jgi:mannose-6-phosphate isomerase-like protein (cupin superfamily)
VTAPTDSPHPQPGTGAQPAPAPGQTWNLPAILRSGASFKTLIGTYVEGHGSDPLPPALDALSAHLWHLKPGDHDNQQPHQQDELYYVLAGSGALTVAGQRHPLVTGDLIFVPRDTPHTFHDFDHPEGLSLLIFFGPNYTGRA